ncbi:MAG: ribosomal protein S18-alanine N-acetyltransferase [Pelosinus sp.]|nr:ribosomal protein S18-alanine N-acetyltransferase [Pelosinus sp.]
MSEFLFRRMMSLDIEGVLAVEVASFTTPWSREAFEAEIHDNELTYYLVVIDTEKKQVIGYAGMWIIVDEAHVTNIAILPDYQGQGLGEKLLKSLMAKAKERGANSMTLEVRRSNSAARGLYAKLGFTQRGVRPGYYTETHEDALIMWCDTL